MKKKARAEASPRFSVFTRSILGWMAGGLAGVFGILLARFLGLPDMASAQITMGMAGFAGGFSHAFVIEAAGGRFRWSQGLILAVIWALCCIGGATPLFLTSGIPLKMTVLTFYSFAAAAALGGLATVYVMKSLSGPSPVDPLPCVFAWSFGFGFAAAATDAMGTALKAFTPVWLAWPAAFAVMAVVIGSAGAYSAIRFYGKGKDWIPASAGMTREEAGMTRFDRACPELAEELTMTNETGFRIESGMTDQGEGMRARWVVFVLLVLPFYLNDFSNIYVKDWRPWLFIDYVSSKLFPCLVILWAIFAKKIPPSEFGLRAQPPFPFMAVFLTAALAGTFLDQNGYLVLRGVPGYPPLGGIPAISDPFWRWVDMTAGLIMVGVFEEIVFRGYMCSFISRFTTSPGMIVGISSVAFGLIHWSGGAHQVLVAGVIGAVFMMLYLRTRSLPAIMLAHFAINFIDYAGVIPKEMFRFL